MGKLAFSVGFNPIGGGGGATYKTGLPSFEYTPSDLPVALVNPLINQTVDGYSIDAFFEGSSVFYGFQGNVSYEINDMISVAVGARYVTARESYTGHLNDIMLLGLNNALMADPVNIPATTYFANAQTSAQGGADNLNAAIGAGLIQATDPLSDPAAIGALTVMGLYTPGMSNGAAAATFGGAAVQYGATSAVLDNQDVDADKTASGITPIVSVNIQPIDILNIAVKYEFATALEFETAADADKQGLLGYNPDGTPKYLFPNGDKTNLDMPAYLAIGATLQPVESLLLAGHFGYYFDKSANWDGRQDLLNSNTYEIALAAEYYLSEKFLVSAGWSYTKTDPTPEYQTDLSYTLPTHGLSFGIGWDIMPMMQLNLGGQYVIYEEGANKFNHDFANSGALFPVTETLAKSVWIVGVGLNITLASKGE